MLPPRSRKGFPEHPEVGKALDLNINTVEEKKSITKIFQESESKTFFWSKLNL